MNRVRGDGGRFNAGDEDEEGQGSHDGMHMSPTMVPMQHVQQVSQPVMNYKNCQI